MCLCGPILSVVLELSHVLLGAFDLLHYQRLFPQCITASSVRLIVSRTWQYFPSCCAVIVTHTEINDQCYFRTLSIMCLVLKKHFFKIKKFNVFITLIIYLFMNYNDREEVTRTRP